MYIKNISFNFFCNHLFSITHINLKSFNKSEFTFKHIRIKRTQKNMKINSNCKIPTLATILKINIFLNLQKSAEARCNLISWVTWHNCAVTYALLLRHERVCSRYDVTNMFVLYVLSAHQASLGFIMRVRWRW